MKLQKQIIFFFVLMLSMVKVGLGQDNITPIRTDVSGFTSWTDTDVSGTTYLQLLKATSTTITPQMNFDSYTGETLNFKARTYGGSNTVENTVYVAISIDNGSTWTEIGSRTPTNTTLNSMLPFDLSTYNSTQVKIKFFVAGTNNSIGVGIDDITITGMPPNPSISLSTLTLSGFIYMDGLGPSSEKTFTVSGSNLTNNISIDAPTNYEISLGTELLFVPTDPIVLTHSGGTVTNTTIYVRLKSGLTQGDYNNEVVTATSSGASEKTVTCSGSVTAPNYITLTGNTYSQDFNTLANSGTSSTLPQGWFLSETGSSANLFYTAGTGSSNSGDSYSFGTTSSTERSLGGLQSGSLIPSWGAIFYNNTGATINQLFINYVGEQWRLGATGREDKIQFSYSLDATSLLDGNWQSVTNLDFISPVTAGSVGALDGNNSQNRSIISGSITNLNIPNNTSFWIRWTDFNATGSDDGMGIDDFSIATSLSEGDVYISHISPMYQTEDDEFIVLFNNNDYEIDLQGYQLISYDAAGSNSNTLYNFVESKKIPARKHLLLSSNVLVNVGSVNKMSDLQFSSNLNSPGGQIIFRQTSKPTNIIFAAAWGTISNYVAGMTNSAQFGSAGMIRLTANGTTYIYNGGMAMNFSNESYSHVTSSEISELPNSGNDPLPVVLSSFNSVYFSRKVLLNWVTSEENNNTGFDIERKQLNGEWSKIGFVNGNGTKYSESNYSFEDRNLQSGKYQYRLKQIDYNGNFEYFNLDGEVEVGVPSKFDLSQNYPNPFNPVTKINYDLPVSGQVSLKIFDMLGKEVASVINEYKEAGYHTISFDASKLTSGVYFYKLTAGNNSAVKKLVVLK